MSALTRTLDPGRAAVGVLVGLAGLLFLLEPFIDLVAVGALRLRPVALSGLVLAVGLDLGAFVFFRRGQSTVALAHAVAGAGWTLLAVSPLIGSGALVLGVMVVVAGALFLAGEARH